MDNYQLRINNILGICKKLEQRNSELEEQNKNLKLELEKHKIESKNETKKINAEKYVDKYNFFELF